jgi:hypothetical protein
MRDVIRLLHFQGDVTRSANHSLLDRRRRLLDQRQALLRTLVDPRVSLSSRILARSHLSGKIQALSWSQSYKTFFS